MARVFVRLWPTAEPVLLRTVDTWRDTLEHTDIDWKSPPLTGSEIDGDGRLLSTDLPDDPEARILTVRQHLGVAKWLAIQVPTAWVQLWDEDGLVEATFGAPLSLFGGVCAGEDGGYDDALETKLADQIAKVALPGLDLGFPPGLPAEVLDALDHGPGELSTDPTFARTLVAAIDRCVKLRRVSASELLGQILDAMDPEVLRDAVVEGYAAHAPLVRRELERLLLQTPDRAVARRVGLDLLYGSPKGQALDDAARALHEFAADPELVAELSEVLLEEGPPQPGTRVEGAAADLLLRTPEGRRAVALRARRDRAHEPMYWWAVRKLLAAPGPDVNATIRLYARAPAVPAWLGEALEAAGLAPGDEATAAEEADALGASPA